MTISELTEGWKPKNKAKHKSCQQRVKNRVSVWPSAYASAQVVQCYYGKKKRKKKAKSVNEMLSNNLCETTVSKEDLQDALQVLKDWSYQVGAIWDTSIDKIWNNLVSNAQIVDINVNELQPHHDWGRRPSAAQMKNPIIVGKLIGGKYLVLDGQHRIIRAKELNKEKIQALVIELPLRYSKMLGRYERYDQVESNRYFHGTSNVYLRNIQQHGLKPNEKGKLYLTTDPFTARVEAFNTVIGDLGYGITSWPPKPKEIKSPGTGGKAVVIELDPKYIDLSKLRSDPEYPSEDQAYYIDYALPAQAIININILGSEPGRDIIDYWMGV